VQGALVLHIRGWLLKLDLLKDLHTFEKVQQGVDQNTCKVEFHGIRKRLADQNRIEQGLVKKSYRIAQEPVVEGILEIFLAKRSTRRLIFVIPVLLVPSSSISAPLPHISLGRFSQEERHRQQDLRHVQQTELSAPERESKAKNHKAN
jgi:hypothetical protein